MHSAICNCKVASQAKWTVTRSEAATNFITTGIAVHLYHDTGLDKRRKTLFGRFDPVRTQRKARGVPFR